VAEALGDLLTQAEMEAERGSIRQVAQACPAKRDGW
jgi:hypothetical protein